ncbi:MCE family protein [Mycolicibacter hiberniae]|uniref:Putative MCE family protein n=1 Tax=Mycolicibacter hiberniae TaxID=29314 RepID=A0A7I7X5N8_9MYCO|nr:MCE family protein [Mycolicibacter hiberniae]MCV7087536.1 MCE family protein [Mycolicibacter hiberniae]ORV69100.1 mammalian cell entry protein [Mycolicibacter hiberniae]BBZ24944.1 putative MCE family protein [Mycolicibacter hiberniae]
MRFRGPLIGLSLFMVVSMALTWLVYATLRRDVAGATTPYAAMFTDVFGLREGDDVRMAGVRVGRVEKVALDGKLAKVSFIVQSDQRLYGNTVASVTYQNIIGQRYLGLSLGSTGSTEELPRGSVIGVEQTDPSFDVGTLLNGFKPLMSLLDPKQADDLTKGVIQSLQGDQDSMATLVEQSSTLTATLAGRDEVLGDLITSLNKVTGTIAGQNDQLDHALTQARRAVADLDSRRPALQSSVGSLAQVTRQLANITDEVFPSFEEMINREPGFTKHLASIEPQLAFNGANLPLLLKGFARMFGEGAYGIAYLCDLNATGFLPGQNDLTTMIINAATPGNARPLTAENLAWFTPRCRNTVDG